MAEDEISFDPNDIITNIEMVGSFTSYGGLHNIRASGALLVLFLMSSVQCLNIICPSCPGWRGLVDRRISWKIRLVSSKLCGGHKEIADIWHTELLMWTLVLTKPILTYRCFQFEISFTDTDGRVLRTTCTFCYVITSYCIWYIVCILYFYHILLSIVINFYLINGIK